MKMVQYLLCIISHFGIFLKHTVQRLIPINSINWRGIDSNLAPNLLINWTEALFVRVQLQSESLGDRRHHVRDQEDLFPFGLVALSAVRGHDRSNVAAAQQQGGNSIEKFLARVLA